MAGLRPHPGGSDKSSVQKNQSRNPQAKSEPAPSCTESLSYSARPEGAAIFEIMRETGWQQHTVRGTLAGALKKRLGLTIDSEKPEGKDRIYRITAGLETL